MDGADAVRHMARFHARHGTTSLLATTVTAPADDLRRAMAGIAEAMRAAGARARGCSARIWKARSSARTRSARSRRSRSRPICRCWSELAAPVTDPRRHLRAGDRPRRRAARRLPPARVRAPRSATPPAATPRPARHWPRVPPASPTCSTRCPACTTATPGPSAPPWRLRPIGRADPRLPPCRRGCRPARRFARVPRLHCVTDAVAAAGMPDGEYQLGAHIASSSTGDTVRLADGSLAGSVLTMDRALRNLLTPGAAAGRGGSSLQHPAGGVSGAGDRGRTLVPGAAADACRASTARGGLLVACSKARIAPERSRLSIGRATCLGAFAGDLRAETRIGDLHVHRDEPLLGRQGQRGRVRGHVARSRQPSRPACRASSSSTCSRGPSARITCSTPRTPIWRSHADFEAWTRSEAFRAAHRNAGGSSRSISGIRSSRASRCSRPWRPRAGRGLMARQAWKRPSTYRISSARHSSTGSSSVGDHQIGLVRRLVGAADPGELRDLARARALVETLRVARLAGVERGLDVDLVERVLGRGARPLAVGAVGRDERA